MSARHVDGRQCSVVWDCPTCYLAWKKDQKASEEPSDVRGTIVREPHGVGWGEESSGTAAVLPITENDKRSWEEEVGGKERYRRVAKLHLNATFVSPTATVRFEMVKGENNTPVAVGAWVKISSWGMSRQPWGRDVKRGESNKWEIFISGAEARAGELS